jgi:serine/threonine protein kinase
VIRFDFQKLAAEMRNDLRAEMTDSARRAPSSIDGFDIIRELASGGMGTVYEAGQRRPDRLVALKLLKHPAVSRSAMRRFEFETQALAQLEHPGIARIFHAGTHDDGSGGVPYFVMELVRDARDITQHCNEKQLSHRQRLRLFADVCDAVHYGHQKRIIHRDLKPSNILVNADGQAKIIDFGVALSTDSDLTATTLTDAGHIIGTLAYMSPEQCTASTSQIDTTTDVYALGVVLYELLCDRLPYDIEGKAHTQVARTIEEQPPTPPSAVRRELRATSTRSC